MSTRTHRSAALTVLLAAGLSLALARSAAAQDPGTTRADDADSVAHVVARQPLHAAEAALRTRNRHVALLLTRETLVLQLTDRGLDHVASGGGDDAGQGAAARILGRMLGAGLAELLDHGIAYELSALRRARADGGRLILEDREGNLVFRDVQVNGRQVMDDFAPAEAERFAAAVNRAIRSRR